MKKNISILLFLITAWHICHAVEKHWVADETLYSGTMTVVGVLQIDGVNQSTNMLEIGAFCGDEVRGSSLPMYIAQLDVYRFFLTIHGDNPCVITFKLWDHNTNQLSLVTTEQTMTYATNATHGSVASPYVMNFLSPASTAYTFVGSGSWNEPSNWRDPSGATPVSMPDLTNEDVVINGAAFIPSGTNEIIKTLEINANKTLTVNGGAALTVSGSITNSDVNALIINDGAQIFQTNANVAATVKKNFINPSVWRHDNTGWQFISSPVENVAIASFIPLTGDYDLYKWDGSLENQWVNYKAHLADFETSFQYGRAYISAYQSQSEFCFSGNLNNATSFDFPVTYTSGGVWENVFLLGNPFTFDIAWADFDLYRLIEGYAVLIPETGAYSYCHDGTIKVGQGFIVEADGKRPELSYPLEEKKRADKYKIINVIANGSAGSDNVVINFNGSENSGFRKLNNWNEEIANIYIARDNRKYGICSCDADAAEIQLCFKAKEFGKYSITLKPEGDFTCLHLIDRLTGNAIDMLLEDEYQFYASGNDNPNRFIIKMNNESSSTETNDFVYQNGSSIVINGSGTVEIIDMTGRLVISENVNGDAGTINIETLRNSVYIVRIINDIEIKTQKMIIK